MKLTTNRPIPTVAEIKRALRDLDWPGITHIDIGERQNRVEHGPGLGLTPNAAMWGNDEDHDTDNDLGDIHPLSDTLRQLRRGELSGPIELDLYCYRWDDSFEEGLQTNADLWRDVDGVWQFTA